MFTAALLVTAKKQKQPKCPSTEIQINKTDTPIKQNIIQQ